MNRSGEAVRGLTGVVFHPFVLRSLCGLAPADGLGRKGDNPLWMLLLPLPKVGGERPQIESELFSVRLAYTSNFLNNGIGLHASPP